MPTKMALRRQVLGMKASGYVLRNYVTLRSYAAVIREVYREGK